LSRAWRSKFANLHGVFEASAKHFADKIALGSGSWHPTYCELNAVANRLAHALIPARAIGDRVAILMQHDTPIVGAILAGLKAGQTVCALDPAHPTGRLRQLAQDAAPTLIITDARHLHLARELPEHL